MFLDLLVLIMGLIMLTVGVTALQDRLNKTRVLLTQDTKSFQSPPPPAGLYASELLNTIFVDQSSPYDRPYQGLSL